MEAHERRLPDGRILRHVEAGDPAGPLLLSQHGTPGSGRLYRAEVEAAEGLGARLVAYSRPGYDGSTPDPGRSVADAAADVAALLDALGAERFATYGWSGGGPHALACAALLPDRCAAAATIAGAAPSDRPDLEFMAGMGEGNIQEFGAALEGRDTLTPMLEEERAGLLGIPAEQVVEAMAPFLSDVDAAALTGDFADHMLGMFRAGLADGVDGWVDDDFDQLLGQLAHVARRPALDDRRVLPRGSGRAEAREAAADHIVAASCLCRSCSTVTQVTMTPSRSSSRRATTPSTCGPSPPSRATARSTSPPATPAAWPRWPVSTCRSPRAPRARAPASW